jgi:hypothetical protein
MMHGHMNLKFGNKIITEILQYVFHASNGNKSHLQAFRLLSGGKNANLLLLEQAVRIQNVRPTI